jgi:hypothetical protein
VKLLPADRLRPLAERLLALQPDPPRAVGTLEVLETYSVLGLLLLPDIVIMIALLSVVGPSARPWIVAIAVAMALFGFALGGFLISKAQTALASGFFAVGDVLTVQPRAWPSYGQHGRLRVDVPGRRFEAEYAWAGSVSVQPGDRLTVLIDAAADRVLLSLGPASSSDGR